jgi:hypothetical protein
MSSSTPEGPIFTTSRPPAASGSLADVLERVLDKGIVVVGDIQVRLLDIELLTIKIRLMVASVDKAREMGIDWWENDVFLSSVEEPDQQGELEQRVRELEQRLEKSEAGRGR